MKAKEVDGLFALAGIAVLQKWRLQNRYYGDCDEVHADHVQRVVNTPWWLLLTPAGLIEIGWRKRVISINWRFTPVRVLVTQDDVTKGEDHVHAWGMADALKYLTELARGIQALPSTSCTGSELVRLCTIASTPPDLYAAAPPR